MATKPMDDADLETCAYHIHMDWIGALLAETGANIVPWQQTATQDTTAFHIKYVAAKDVHIICM